MKPVLSGHPPLSGHYRESRGLYIYCLCGLRRSDNWPSSSNLVTERAYFWLYTVLLLFFRPQPYRFSQWSWCSANSSFTERTTSTEPHSTNATSGKSAIRRFRLGNDAWVRESTIYHFRLDNHAWVSNNANVLTREQGGPSCCWRGTEPKNYHANRTSHVSNGNDRQWSGY